MAQDKLSQVLDTKPVKIKLGEKEVEIKKLKSGDYYKAQTKLLNMMFKMAGGAKASDVKQSHVNVDDLSKQLPTALDQFPNELFGFLAITTSVDEEYLKNETYPEDLSKAIEVVMELNNFKENLNSSLKPMQAMGK